MKRWRAIPYAIIAVLALIALTLIVHYKSGGGSQTGLSVAPSWSVLHVGMSVFTGGADGQTVCPTMASLFDFGQARPTPCVTVRRGTPATVDAIVPCKKTDPAWGYESPHVLIRSRDGAWRGFTDADLLQPVVPTGTVLDLERDWGAPLSIETDHGARTVPGGSALVRVVRYDPARDASLYVEVLHGSFRGQRGWAFIQNANIPGVALGEYDIEYSYKACPAMAS